MPLLLSPAVSEIAAAPVIRTVSGWGDPALFAGLGVPPFDIGVDAGGSVYVLVRVGRAWEVYRFGTNGKLETTFRTELPAAEYASIAVDGEGNCILNSLSNVEIRDRTGKRLASWTVPSEPPSDVALWRDGRVLFCLPRRGIVQLFSRSGRPEDILRLPPEENGAPGPTGVAVSSDGMLLVADEMGRVHLFRSSVDRFAPERVETFRVAYPEVPFLPDLKGCAFDGPNLLIFPHHSRSVPLVYDLQGRRVLAATPDRDLAAKGFQRATAAFAAGDTLYVIDSEARSVVKVSRR
jgi:sugar lactone lactonase YvrE